MASGPIEIPDPRTSGRTRLAMVNEPEKWVSPYTGEQALAVALFNSQAKGTLEDCFRVAKNAMPYLDAMTFEIRQKA